MTDENAPSFGQHACPSCGQSAWHGRQFDHSGREVNTGPGDICVVCEMKLRAAEFRHGVSEFDQAVAVAAAMDGPAWARATEALVDVQIAIDVARRRLAAVKSRPK